MKSLLALAFAACGGALVVDIPEQCVEGIFAMTPAQPAGSGYVGRQELGLYFAGLSASDHIRELHVTRGMATPGLSLSSLRVTVALSGLIDGTIADYACGCLATPSIVIPGTPAVDLVRYVDQAGYLNFNINYTGQDVALLSPWAMSGKLCFAGKAVLF